MPKSSQEDHLNEEIVKSDRLRRLAKEGAWIVVGQIASAIGSLVLVRVLTEYLDPFKYGQLALALTLGVLVCQVSMSGVMPGIMRFYTIAVEKGDFQGYTYASRRMMVCGTLVTIAIGVLLLTFAFISGHKSWLGLLATAIILTQISSYNATLSSIQNAARQRAVVAFHNAIDPWFRIGMSTGMFVLFGRTPLSALFGYTVAALVLLASQWFFFLRLSNGISKSNQSGSTQWVKQFIEYSRPFMIFNMFTWAQSNSDRWSLQTFSSTHTVGQFSVLMQLGYAPISIFTNLLSNFISPILNQRAGDASDQARLKSVHSISAIITLLCLGATLVIFLATMLLHEQIFQVFVASEYRNSSHLLPWILLAGGVMSAGEMLSLKLMSDLNTRALLWPKLITAIVGICLNYAGAYYYDLQGVVAAAVVISLISLLWLAVLMRKSAGSYKVA